MKKYSKDKDINLLVHQLLKSGVWQIRRGRHPVLTAPSGKRLTVPSTPSDRRAFLNFKLDVRRLQGL
ncbi:hypothetical protein [Shewanella colwelliana]|uniref:hypothetical protein n=1 Tax=Shewanella colwelliana TaxID=23 RepID=UPI00299E04A5|nr:hypothetical protein [Shewanella colwelliana]MDX1282962.1 hypothetical protein [Shewanella colwelliana]